MQALGPDGPWTSKDRQQRKDANRPCIHLDQLNQYCNLLINEFRQTPIMVDVEPAGGKANKDVAELRGDRQRRIEEDSNAIHAYIAALEGSVQRGYGAFGVITEEKSWDTWEQQIRYRAFPNPDAVIWDPDCKLLTFADMEYCFVIDRFPKDMAKEKYGDNIGDFGTENVNLSQGWMDDTHVQIAEYWEKTYHNCEVYELIDGTTITSDDLEEQGKTEDDLKGQIKRQKTGKKCQIQQCMTDGRNIWDLTDVPGNRIGIFPVIGKRKYVREAGSNKVEMVLESYITNALDAAQLYDYYKTAEVEVVSMTPKTPYFVIDGQLDEPMQGELVKSMDEPVAFVRYKATLDNIPGTVLPPPTRQPYEPQIVALETGAESARRAIQSALGSFGVSKLDDTNVKSGIAIEKLNRQSESGAFHFVDHLKIQIKEAGKHVGTILDLIEDSPRDVGLRKKDGKGQVIRIHEPGQDEDGKPTNYTYSNGDNDEYEVSYSTKDGGQTRHEEQQEFMNKLAGASDPEVVRTVLPRVVRLQQLGPEGDELATDLEALVPPQVQQARQKEGDVPPQVAAQMQQMQQEIQMRDAFAQKLMQEKAELEQKLNNKQLEADTRLQVEGMKTELAKMKLAFDQQQAAQQIQVDTATTHEELTTQERISEEDNRSKEKIAFAQMQHRSEEQTRQIDAASQSQETDLAHQERLAKEQAKQKPKPKK